MSDLISWLAAIIFIEAVVEIEVESEIFIVIRDKISRIKRLGWLAWYFNGLLSCGYCLSVWVSSIVAIVITTQIVSWPENDIIRWIINFILRIFILHRLSNIWHEIVHRLINRMPYILAFKGAPNELPEFLGGDDEPTASDPEHNNRERNGAPADVNELLAGERQPGEEDINR